MSAPVRTVPKIVGADVELGNLLLGASAADHQGTGSEASKRLLREIDGAPAGSSYSSNYAAGYQGNYAYGQPWQARDAYGSYDPQDVGRKFLRGNGGCAYIDLDHLEICTPECLSAFDHVAAWHAMLRIARNALHAANSRLPADERLVVLVNNSDGLGNAYGSHLSFMISRELWDDLFVRRLHPSLFVLLAHQVSSIVLTGQGKVGSENGRHSVDYQIAQRADFFAQIVGPQTTFNRPICNSRDEPLCGPSTTGPDDLARLHCIFFDATLCHVSNVLKVGTMQLVLAMLEAGQFDAATILEDPLSALEHFSHDPDLYATAPLANGRPVTAVQLQGMFCQQAREFVDRGGAEGLVPDAERIVALWEDTLDLLGRRDFDALAPRLDWVLKRTQIERALAARKLPWSNPAAKRLDHLYAELDPERGLYWALEHAGVTEQLVADEVIERHVTQPPNDTRAWSRALLLRSEPNGNIRHVDWDVVELAPATPGAPPRRYVLPNPAGHTLADARRRAAQRAAKSAGGPPTLIRHEE